MSENTLECPKCGETDIEQECDEVSRYRRYCLDGDVVEEKSLSGGEATGIIECACHECGYSWKVDSGLVVIPSKIYVAQIATDSLFNDGPYFARTYEEALHWVAEFARREWEGEEPLPEDDDHEAAERFFYPDTDLGEEDRSGMADKGYEIRMVNMGREIGEPQNV